MGTYCLHKLLLSFSKHVRQTLSRSDSYEKSASASTDLNISRSPIGRIAAIRWGGAMYVTSLHNGQYICSILSRWRITTVSSVSSVI